MILFARFSLEKTLHAFYVLFDCKLMITAQFISPTCTTVSVFTHLDFWILDAKTISFFFSLVTRLISFSLSNLLNSSELCGDR